MTEAAFRGPRSPAGVGALSPSREGASWIAAVVGMATLLLPLAVAGQNFDLPTPPIGPTTRDQCRALNQEALELTRRYNAEALSIVRRADRTLPLGSKEWEAERARASRLVEEAREDFQAIMNMVSECHQGVSEYERRVGAARKQIEQGASPVGTSRDQ